MSAYLSLSTYGAETVAKNWRLVLAGLLYYWPITTRGHPRIYLCRAIIPLDRSRPHPAGHGSQLLADSYTLHPADDRLRSLSGFFSGISRTSVVMWSNLLITVLNLAARLRAEYLVTGACPNGRSRSRLGNGHLRSRRHRRAAVDIPKAPNIASVSKPTCTGNPTGKLFKRLLHFGFPVGLQMQMQTLAWTMFVLLIGKIGVAELTAHSIAMNVFMMAVMPVSRNEHRRIRARRSAPRGLRPRRAERATHSAVHLAAVFFVFAGIMLRSSHPTGLSSPFHGVWNLNLSEQPSP